jgi:hypothetical protein
MIGLQRWSAILPALYAQLTKKLRGTLSFRNELD